MLLFSHACGQATRCTTGIKMTESWRMSLFFSFSCRSGVRVHGELIVVVQAITEEELELRSEASGWVDRGDDVHLHGVAGEDEV
jgi:hypothetical protein